MSAAEFPHALVVDDNPDASELLAILIEAEGFTVATARALREGREEIDRQRPDIVFLDLNLPDGNGLSLLEEIKSDQVTAGMAVAVLSGMTDARLKEQAHLLGAAAFLVKPLSHDHLVAVLRQVR